MNILTPKIGVNSLMFGEEISEVRQSLGEPDDVNTENEHEIFEYYEKGMSLFFSIKTSLLDAIEIEGKEVLLWGCQIMRQSPDRIKEILEDNECDEIEIFDDPKPCLIYKVKKLGLELYFEDGKLMIITASSFGPKGSNSIG